MQIQINTDRNIKGTRHWSLKSVALWTALSRFSGHITRVEVHLSDGNSRKKGGHDDMRCVMEARLEGRQPIAVTHQATTVDLAVDGAADKLTRMIESTIGKLQDQKRRRTDPPPPGGEASGGMMRGCTASLRRTIGGAWDLPSIVRTMKAWVARIELVGYIEKSVGRPRGNGPNQSMLHDWVLVPRSAYRCSTLVLRAVLLSSVCAAATSTAMAQDPGGKAGLPQSLSGPGTEDLSLAPAKVDVNPVARDEEIHSRLQSVLEATDWFTNPQVRVDEGVVFLNGQVSSEDRKKWAGDLARNIQDVVAVANRIEVLEPSVWDLRPAWRGLFELWRDVIRSFPLFVFGLLVLALSVGAGLMTTRGVRTFLRRRIRANLLRKVIARGAGGLVFLFGTYIILRVAGLTQLALTVVGGTGLIGLAVGIAFRDITENFLASIFLSMQRPFETGDLIQASGVTGYVQQLNVRTTILMNLDGNIVQIPNATVYKSTLRNFTTNPNRREDFDVGIGYDDSIDEAQEIARRVLESHPAVLNDPEPSVLADSLGKATVNLRIYFWLDGREHSWLKVRSSVIRLVKRAFQQHGISMPDVAREVVFPQGIPVTILDRKPEQKSGATPEAPRVAQSSQDQHDEVSTKAEGGLHSEAGVIKAQARQTQPLKQQENLLKAPASTAPSDDDPG